MVLKIIKETSEKCGITLVEYYNKKEDKLNYGKKTNDVKRETGHLNISDTTLRIIRKYCGNKTNITEKEKKIQIIF